MNSEKIPTNRPGFDDRPLIKHNTPNDNRTAKNRRIFKMKINNDALRKIKLWIVQNLILILTVFGVLGGICVGFIGRKYKISNETLTLLYFPGELFLRVLKMLILPLIISSLISGLAQLDPKSSGKMGSLAISFYFLTTIIATITGIILVVLMHPGNPNQKTVKQTVTPNDKTSTLNTLDAMLDIVRNMFPENLVQACSQQVSTFYKKKLIRLMKPPNGTFLIMNRTNGSMIQTQNSSVYEFYEERIIKELKYTDGTNVMGIVVFCFVFGIVISKAKSDAQIMFDFFLTLNELIMRIVEFIMWFSPIGILCLIATNIIKIDDLGETAKRLGLYMITVILGLIVHSLFTLQLAYFLITRKNPFKFLKGMLQAWLTAVGTASSAATLPITFRCLEENNKIDKRVTRFMLPLGATINMDGTALYEAVATIFIAQINGVELGIGKLIAISLSATATSIGAASIPSAALVTMLIVLSTVGLPTEDLSYIVAVDWLLDRLRTSINVLGDAYGAGIVEHLSREQLKKLDADAEEEYATFMATAIANVPTTATTQPTPIETQTPEYTFKNKLSLGLNSIHSCGGIGVATTAGCGHHIMMPYNEAVQDRRTSCRSCLSNSLTPSLNVMNAIRRRSKIILFNSNDAGLHTVAGTHMEHETNL